MKEKANKEVITVVVANSNEMVRQGVRSLLEMEPDIRVVGEAEDGLKTVQIVQELHPKVLIIELMISGLSDIKLIKQVKKTSKTTNIVVFSMYDNAEYVKEAFKAGARAYVLKESTGPEIIQAVRRAATGRNYLSSSISDANSN